MHLPGKITRNGGTLVKYSYLADGSKASVLKGNGEGLVYRSSLIYRRASDGTLSLESVAFAEGTLTPEGVRYHALAPPLAGSGSAEREVLRRESVCVLQ